MKELTTVAHNVCAGISESGKIRPMAEVVLILSEPMHRKGLDGGIIRDRELSQVRFGATVGSLRTLADVLLEIAEDIEKQVGEAVAKTAGQGGEGAS